MKKYSYLLLSLLISFNVFAECTNFTGEYIAYFVEEGETLELRQAIHQNGCKTAQVFSYFEDEEDITNMNFDGVERTVVTDSISITSSYRIQGNRISFQEKTFNLETPEELFFTNGTLTMADNGNIEVFIHDSDNQGNSDTLEYLMKRVEE